MERSLGGSRLIIVLGRGDEGSNCVDWSWFGLVGNSSGREVIGGGKVAPTDESVLVGPLQRGTSLY